MAFKRGSYSLLDDASATGEAIDWVGGEGVFAVTSGTFGGAAVALQFSPDEGTTWMDVDQGDDAFVSLTEAGAGSFKLPPIPIRAAVTGGTPSGLNAVVLAVAG